MKFHFSPSTIMITLMMATGLSACSAGHVSINSPGNTDGSQNKPSQKAGSDPKDHNPGSSGPQPMSSASTISFEILPTTDQGDLIKSEKIGLVLANSKNAQPIKIAANISRSGSINGSFVSYQDSLIYIRKIDDLHDAIALLKMTDQKSQNLAISDVPVKSVDISTSGGTLFWLDVKGHVYSLTRKTLAGKSASFWMNTRVHLPAKFKANAIHASGHDTLIVQGSGQKSQSLTLVYSIQSRALMLERSETAIDIGISHSGSVEAVIEDDQTMEKLFITALNLPSSAQGNMKVIAEGVPGTIHQPSWSTNDTLLAYWMKTDTEAADVRIANVDSGTSTKISSISPISTTTDVICPSWGKGDELFFGGIGLNLVHSILKASRHNQVWRVGVFARPDDDSSAYICPHVSIPASTNGGGEL
jgi:hypothetical protein